MNPVVMVVPVSCEILVAMLLPTLLETPWDTLAETASGHGLPTVSDTSVVLVTSVDHVDCLSSPLRMSVPCMTSLLEPAIGR